MYSNNNIFYLYIYISIFLLVLFINIDIEVYLLINNILNWKRNINIFFIICLN